jgi:two-component system sensor histidine kinase PilS (NtrC family)
VSHPVSDRAAEPFFGEDIQQRAGDGVRRRVEVSAGRASSAPAGPAEGMRRHESAALWRALYYFNAYRLIAATLLVVIASTWGPTLQFGSRDYVLFVSVAFTQCVLSTVWFLLMRARWRFDLQLALQVGCDLAATFLLTYASRGITSGLGLLLLTTVAAAGLVARGRHTLSYAALASVAMWLEHTVEVMKFDAPVALYAQPALLSAAYFAIAWLAHELAKYAVASEELAAQREVDLENMAQVSEHVIQDMHDGVLVVDGLGVIRQFNARTERLLGPLGARRDMALSQYSPAIAQRFAAWREDEHANAPAAYMSITADIAVRIVPVGRRRSAGAVIFLEDRTRIQSEARQMKLAAMGRLTANIAHEIRNPLGAISHATELLQEEPASTDTARRLITIIHDNTERLNRMVNDVLKLRRTDSVHSERFKVAEYLNVFVEQFCQIEKISPDIFSIDLRADPQVIFDRSHLNQVMWNLSRNALRHCRRERGSIRVAVDEIDGGDTVKLDVMDDGPGVAPALRGQLFEPFFTTAMGGTGLGLYIAREVCEANNAKLDYTDQPHGACFTVLCRAADE